MYSNEFIEMKGMTPEQHVRFGILFALKVCNVPQWDTWANNWLSGKDRSAGAAVAAEQLVQERLRLEQWAALMSDIQDEDFCENLLPFDVLFAVARAAKWLILQNPANVINEIVLCRRLLDGAWEYHDRIPEINFLELAHHVMSE